ncbi:HD domain-containing protein [Hyphomicrobium sp. CS1BSMeth3]|uniref:HD domain-containing protein n=1 Tax=Hyphomicrobium sp. CS1BSMeth3 TaxID=1892844 RepID=UPI00092FF78A|nr:HD domain-containing protein [Hyphomicrobium sp. CS1BSMeth3]
MPKSESDALKKQLEFLLELDRLKLIVRQSHLANGARRENSAEHSWHLAMFALALSSHADAKVDVARVIQLLLLHDIVEIDAGDAPIHAANGSKADLAAAEQRAAERIFGILPSDQAAEFCSIWLEFEAGQSPEARFAKALDRLQPLLLNVAVGGGTWSENGVGVTQVIERYGPAIAGGSTMLWEAARKLVEQHFSKAPSGG